MNPVGFHIEVYYYSLLCMLYEENRLNT